MYRAFILLVAAFVLHGQAAEPATASRPVSAGMTAAGCSSFPQFSADGRHLVFLSTARNLVTNDDVSPWQQVFARDLDSGSTQLISVDSAGDGAANSEANYPVVSSNGGFVAFVSRADNLVGNDGNAADDVFLRDVSNKTTRLISVNVAGHSPNDPAPWINSPLSGNPLLSDDGRWVVFESRATNLTSIPDLNSATDVFARDTWSNRTVLVSANSSGTAAAGGQSLLHAISADARFALFSSTAGDVLPGVPTNNVYLRDIRLGQTVWAGTNVLSITNPLLSASGDVVAFVEPALDPATNQLLGFGRLLRVNRGAGTTEVLATNVLTSQPVYMTRAGSALAFTVTADGVPSGAAWRLAGGFHDLGRSNVVVGFSDSGAFILLQVPSGATKQLLLTNDLSASAEWVSVDEHGNPTQVSHEFTSATVNFDGSLVGFDSDATTLVAADFNRCTDVFLHHGGMGSNELISAAAPVLSPATAVAMSALNRHAISADGRMVVSTRYDDPSMPRDTNLLSDVFLTDISSGWTRSVSLDTNLYVTTGGSGTITNVATNSSPFGMPVISADGSAIAASRGRFPLTTSYPDMVVTRTDNVQWVAVTGGGTSPSADPMFNGDGTLLAFVSTSTSLTPDSYPFVATNVFLARYHPVSNGVWAITNRLISRSTNDLSAGNGISTRPVIELDGRWLVFSTMASNLVWPTAAAISPTNRSINRWAYPAFQLVAAYLVTNGSETNDSIMKRLCSYNLSTDAPPWSYTADTDPSHVFTTLKPLAAPVTNAVFAERSHYVVFGLADGSAIFRHDLLGVRTNWYEVAGDTNAGGPAVVLTNTIDAGAPNVLVCSNCWNPSVSDDGNTVVFERLAPGASFTNVYVVDLLSGKESLVSSSPSGLPKGNSKLPGISGDGRYVVFQSDSTDLVPGDANGTWDIFLRDRLLGATILVSANSRGGSGNGPSMSPQFSPGGRAVVFQSFASDLVPRDYNNTRDAFVLAIAGADSDQDGMDDDWEVAYFGNLSRDGTGDFDGDGVSDRDEFLAGTDPTNNGSVFRLLAVTMIGATSKQLIWIGNPSRSYRVEYKDDLASSAWLPLDGTVSWSDSTARLTDNAPAPTRFYRVVRLP